MILRLPPLPAPEPNYREHRMASPKFVRCPRMCDPAIGCPQCCFWGTVPADSQDAQCIHDNRMVGAITQTLHTWQCIKCGAVSTVDSSG